MCGYHTSFGYKGLVFATEAEYHEYLRELK